MRALALAVVAAMVATPPAPSHHVEDRAAFLTPATRDLVDAKLDAYERATGHQIVVWIDRTIGDAPLDDWAVKSFETWQLGRKGYDDGIAIFILSDDRRIDIEVGYGLEERVPDAVASRVIREVMAPRVQGGDRDGAVIAGVDAVLAAIEGKPWVAPAVATSSDDVRLRWALYIILAVIGLLLMIKYPRAAMWLFWSIASSGMRGSGDRFRGGGGRSGGGGARGGW